MSVNDCIVRGLVVGPEGLVTKGYMYLFICMSDQ